VHVLAAGTTPELFERAEHDELADLIDGEWVPVEAAAGVVLERAGSVRTTTGRAPVVARKSIVPSGGRRDPALELRIELTNRSDVTIDGLLAVEWALNLLGGGGNPSAWLEVDGVRGRFDAPRLAERAAALAMVNVWVGIRVDATADPEASMWWSSIDTISVSEHGFEANHQGGCLLWVWPLHLAPGASTEVAMTMRVTAAVDRAEEEGL
jgi:4-alpha-glucanotransferase